MVQEQTGRSVARFRECAKVSAIYGGFLQNPPGQKIVALVLVFEVKRRTTLVVNQ